MAPIAPRFQLSSTVTTGLVPVVHGSPGRWIARQVDCPDMPGNDGQFGSAQAPTGPDNHDH